MEEFDSRLSSYQPHDCLISIDSASGSDVVCVEDSRRPLNRSQTEIKQIDICLLAFSSPKRI